MIKFYCKCGQKVGVKEHLAGKTARCPRCKANIEVPSDNDVLAQRVQSQGGGKPDHESGFLADQVETQQNKSRDEMPQSGEYVLADDTNETKKCLNCGGTILASANKCRHCREFLNGRNSKLIMPNASNIGVAFPLARRVDVGPGKGKAVVSLVCGILAIPLGPFILILAIIAIYSGGL